MLQCRLFMSSTYHRRQGAMRYPSPPVRMACRAMVRAGPVLYLCQHSHCVGCMETFRDELLYMDRAISFC
jgi:poly-gamma-glutamate synthesis protein (capsule biosynthesis protein)